MMNNFSRIMPKIAPVFGVLSVALWGGSFAAVKIAEEQLTIFDALCARMLISSIILLPYLIWRIAKVGFPKLKILLLMALVGTLSFPVTLGFQFAALHYLEATISSIGVGLESAFTMVAAYILFKKKPTKTNFFVALVSLAGILVAVGVPNRSHAEGLFLILCANISAGFAIVLTKPLFENQSISVLEKTAYIIVIGTMILLFFNPAFYSNPHLMQLKPAVIKAVLFLSVGSTVMGYIFHNLCLKYLSATRTSQFIVIEPIVGVFAGVFIVGEPFTLGIFLGTILVVMAIIVNSLVKDNG